jgi:prepilin-type N-terminal cleavage/methylation domain-containing protein/prepilin-type processing-associated H-X9-DG protein
MEIFMVTKKGFTLIELLVVIAIIALLLAILIPSLRAAKEIASGSVCLSDQKQLSLAWTAYAEDNKSMLVGGSNYSPTLNATKPTPYRWVEYPLLTDVYDSPPVTLDSQLTIETRKNGIRAGKLYPYTQKEDLYHCPGDKNFTKPEPLAVYRSYAIAGLMNGEDFVNRVSGVFSPIATYRYAITSPGGTSKKLYVVIKGSEIKSPGNKYVFVEEDVTMKSQKDNLGGFVLLENGAYAWWDWPAYYHNDSSTLGFADGHSERHRWEDPRTIRLMKYGTTLPLGISVADASVNNKDLDWMVRGYLPTPVQ